MKGNKRKWIIIRNNEIIYVSDTRQECVKYFKEMLKTTLNDFKNQDKKDCEYDYGIAIPEIRIKAVNYRETYLGL